MLAICVRFCSCLCKVCSLVSEALLLALQTLSLSFLTSNSSSDRKAFLRFIAFSGSSTAVHRAFLFFDAKAAMATVTNWPLHVHYGITLWEYLSQTHRPIALHCMHYGITLWAYLSEPLVKDTVRQSQTSKFDGKLQVTWSHITVTYVLRRGIRKHCTWRKWLT